MTASVAWRFVHDDEMELKVVGIHIVYLYNYLSATGQAPLGVWLAQCGPNTRLRGPARWVYFDRSPGLRRDVNRHRGVGVGHLHWLGGTQIYGEGTSGCAPCTTSGSKYDEP